jgi:TolB protein
VARRPLLLAAAAGVAAAAALSAVALFVTDDDAPAGEGDEIAYGCKEPKNAWYAICLTSVDGAERRRLTTGLPTTDPTWSPDGRRIAFTRNEDVGESTTFTFDDVFVMDADGGDPTQVTPDEENLWSGQPSWSPDGRELVYVRGDAVASTVLSKYGSLYRIQPDGDGRERLTTGQPDTDPAWSPDGRAIAFIRGVNLASPTASNDDLYVLELRTGEETKLTRSPHGTYEAAPAWSPDGTRIAFARYTNQSQFDGTASIHVLDRDGSNERRLLEHKLFAYSPYSLAWSPDGRSLAFETSSMFGCTSISILDVGSGAVRPLTTCSRPREATVAPDWQPAPDRAG